MVCYIPIYSDTVYFSVHFMSNWKKFSSIIPSSIASFPFPIYPIHNLDRYSLCYLWFCHSWFFYHYYFTFVCVRFLFFSLLCFCLFLFLKFVLCVFLFFFLQLFFWYGLFFKKLNPSTDKLDSCCQRPLCSDLLNLLQYCFCFTF